MRSQALKIEGGIPDVSKHCPTTVYSLWSRRLCNIGHVVLGHLVGMRSSCEGKGKKASAWKLP